jgi:hypothetical protein
VANGREAKRSSKAHGNSRRSGLTRSLVGGEQARVRRPRGRMSVVRSGSEADAGEDARLSQEQRFPEARGVSCRSSDSSIALVRAGQGSLLRRRSSSWPACVPGVASRSHWQYGTRRRLAGRRPGGLLIQRVMVVPTVLSTKASGNRAAIRWTAFQPVQWAGTSSEGSSSASASTVGSIIGSNMGPLR